MKRCDSSFTKTDLIRDAEDAHFRILHFQDRVLDHELAAQVAVIRRTHGIHFLQQETKALNRAASSSYRTAAAHAGGILSTFGNERAFPFRIPMGLAPSSGG